MLEQLLSPEIRQQQTISPQMYHSLQVLQMNAVQLDDYIQNAVLENPVLDHREEGIGGVQSLEGLHRPLRWEWEENTGWWREEDGPGRDVAAPDAQSSLRQHLASQFHPRLSREELALLDAVMDHLDGAGYLTATDEEISEMSGHSPEYVGYGVAYLQRLDPLGVCARSLEECLRIQLEMQDYRDPALLRLVGEHLADLGAGRYGRIARALERDVADIRAYCEVVRSLQPKPGACFGDETAGARVPDFLVYTESGEPRGEFVRHNAVSVKVNEYYARLAAQDDLGEAAAYLAQKLQQAQWLVKAVESREKTLRSILDIVLREQRGFFLSDGGTLRPLTLRDAAQELGLSESTVSRAINGKYLQCSRGVYPLKRFFTHRAGQRADGAPVSRDAVQERIRALIDGEDKRAPLSDNRLSELLTDEGIFVSRRAVAKYRGEMGIGTAQCRRE